MRVVIGADYVVVTRNVGPLNFMAVSRQAGVEHTEKYDLPGGGRRTKGAAAHGSDVSPASGHRQVARKRAIHRTASPASRKAAG